MSAGFTPGPWTTESRVGENFVREAKPWATNPVRRNAVAQVTVAGRTAAEIAANQCLIAAAPDLYEALKAIDIARTTDLSADWSRATELSDAALAKAVQS